MADQPREEVTVVRLTLWGKEELTNTIEVRVFRYNELDEKILTRIETYTKVEKGNQ